MSVYQDGVWMEALHERLVEIGEAVRSIATHLKASPSKPDIRDEETAHWEAPDRHLSRDWTLEVKPSNQHEGGWMAVAHIAYEGPTVPPAASHARCKEHAVFLQLTSTISRILEKNREEILARTQDRFAHEDEDGRS